MKRITVLLLLLCTLFALPSLAAEQEMRGVWVASVYNLDYPSAPGLSEAQLKQEADKIIAKTAESGLNTIFLQVRPCADSLFPSSLFPWSVYLSGEQGKTPDGQFDPLQYFITQASAKNIAIHAWLNPYRVTKGNFTSKEAALASLSASHPAKAVPEATVLAPDGNLYFDPGSPTTRKLILDGVTEILDNYNVAGIHLDDYFYPSNDFADNQTYATYQTNSESLEDFRRRQVNETVYALYDLVKAKNKTFGISPFGVWANKSDHPLGSETKSAQSYFDHYADTRKWVLDGKLDYIMPQIYWNTGHAQADYTTLLNWWNSVVDGTGVKLYVGLAAYRIPEAKEGEPWFGTAEIANQLQQNQAALNCAGFTVFRMGNLFDVPGLSNLLSTRSPVYQDTPLTVTVPSEDIKTTLSRFYFCGKSDSAITVNGVEYPISQEGYFSFSLPLCYGDNNFVFQTGGYEVTRKIHRAYSTAPPKTRTDLYFQSPNGLLGIPLYTGQSNGVLQLKFDTNNIKQSPSGAFSVAAKEHFTNVYGDPSTESGAVGWLMKGNRFNATAFEKGFAYLENLGWVKEANLTVTKAQLPLKGEITAIHQLEDAEAITMDFAFQGEISPVILQENGEFKLVVGGARDTVLPEGEPITGVAVTYDNGGLTYSFPPPLEKQLMGYHLEQYDKYFRLILRKKPILTESADKPLTNIRILIDAGHGGGALGALSCDPAYPEKVINLKYANLLGQKLSDLGATVTYTRQDDIDLSLDARFQAAYDQMPHLFLSIHSNSVNYNLDPRTATGVSFYTNGTYSEQLGDFLLEHTKSAGINSSFHTKNSNLYMAKPKFCYALLSENGFVVNPASLSALLSDIYSERFTEALAKGILGFFQ